MGEERERTKAAQEEQDDVEGHRNKPMTDEPDESDQERREGDEEEPDVEAHRFKA